MEGLFNRKDINLSLKLGFLGLGMGGCSIAAECASIKTNITNNMNPYTALLINTNKVDLDKIEASNHIKKFLLKGYEKGAGRNIHIGEEAYRKHADDITKTVVDYFNDRDFVFIVAGMGGGTGTGAVIESIRTLHKNGFKGKFGLILTLPRNKEGAIVLENALERLQTIAKVMSGLGSMIIVDNEKLYNDYIEDHPNSSISEYLDYSNKFIAKTLHELNVVTASFKPYGGIHFDSSEFYNMLRTSGVLSFSKIALKDSEIDTGSKAGYLTPFKNSIENGILSSGYKFSTAKQAAVSMITSASTAKRVFTMDFINSFEQILDNYVPKAGEKPIATYTDENIKYLYIYSMFAGLSLPQRVSQLVEVAEQIKTQNNETEKDEALEALSNFRRTEEIIDEEMDIDSILDEDIDNKNDSEEAKKDPLDEILG